MEKDRSPVKTPPLDPGSLYFLSMPRAFLNIKFGALKILCFTVR